MSIVPPSPRQLPVSAPTVSFATTSTGTKAAGAARPASFASAASRRHSFRSPRLTPRDATPPKRSHPARCAAKPAAPCPRRSTRADGENCLRRHRDRGSQAEIRGDRARPFPSLPLPQLEKPKNRGISMKSPAAEEGRGARIGYIVAATESRSVCLTLASRSGSEAERFLRQLIQTDAQADA